MAHAPSPAPRVVEGFALPGTRSLGCLLVHGFTGTPWEMRPLGEALAARGFPVRAPRLAGHGTDVMELARTRWTDWYASVEESFAALARDVPRVAAVGLSMGGLLVLHLAATRRADVAALVLAGTPLWLGEARARWLPVAARIPPLWGWIARRYGVIPKVGGPDIADPAMRAASPSYQATPVAGVLEVLRLQALARAELRRVTQPALLLHGRDDHSVPLANLDLLRRGLGSSIVETHVLERSFHVITVDYDRDEVARLVGDFLDRV